MQLNQSNPQHASRTFEQEADESMASVGGKTAKPPKFAPTASQKPKYKNPESVPVGPSTMTLGGLEYTAQKGDNLWTLADRFYFEPVYWHHIYQANREICGEDGQIIQTGSKLSIPGIEVSMLNMILNNQNRDDRLKYLAERIDKQKYFDYRYKISNYTNQESGVKFQRFELILETGMSLEEMGKAAYQNLDEQANTRNGLVKDVFAQPSLIDQKQVSSFQMEDFDNWEKRMFALVRKLEKSGSPEIQKIIQQARLKNKGAEVFVFDPVKCEEIGVIAYTQSDYKIYVGTKWIEKGEKNIELIYGNIAHELGGHNEYGEKLSQEMGGQLSKYISWEDWNDMVEKGNNFRDIFGLYETEIWAELREYNFVVKEGMEVAEEPNGFEPYYPDHITEVDPSNGRSEMDAMIGGIYINLPPKIGNAFFKAMYNRAVHDKRIDREAVKMFRLAILSETKVDPAK